MLNNNKEHKKNQVGWEPFPSTILSLFCCFFARGNSDQIFKCCCCCLFINDAKKKKRKKNGGKIINVIYPLTGGSVSVPVANFLCLECTSLGGKVLAIDAEKSVVNCWETINLKHLHIINVWKFGELNFFFHTKLQKVSFSILSPYPLITSILWI